MDTQVCNHPDLFEPRMIVSPFCGCDALVQHEPQLLASAPLLSPIVAAEGFAVVRSPLSCVSRHLLRFGWVDAEVAGECRWRAARCKELAEADVGMMASIPAIRAAYEAAVALDDTLPPAFASGAVQEQRPAYRLRVQKRFVAAITALHSAVTARRESWVRGRVEGTIRTNARRCAFTPLYGLDCRRAVAVDAGPAGRVLRDSADPRRWQCYSAALRGMVSAGPSRITLVRHACESKQETNAASHRRAPVCGCVRGRCCPTRIDTAAWSRWRRGS